MEDEKMQGYTIWVNESTKPKEKPEGEPNVPCCDIFPYG